jgi:hypothetical protein
VLICLKFGCECADATIKCLDACAGINTETHSNYVELFKIVLELTCAKVINYSFCKIIIITNLAINHRGKSVMTPL